MNHLKWKWNKVVSGDALRHAYTPQGYCSYRGHLPHSQAIISWSGSIDIRAAASRIRLLLSTEAQKKELRRPPQS